MEKRLSLRQRFQKLMEFEDPGELPVIEWAFWWDKTIAEWKTDGMPDFQDGIEIQKYFGLDLNFQLWLNHYTERCPRPDSTTGKGIITSWEDYKRIRPDILPEDAAEQMLPELERIMPLREKGEILIWYTLDGFFWFPRELFGIENHLYAFYDQPKLYHRICEELSDWHLRMIEKLSRYVQADFMTFAEDMSYNLGPMISEEMFREFMLPYYKKVIPEIKKHQTRVFVDSDGDITQAVPWFLEAGIEGILPLEQQSGVSLSKLRETYPRLLMIGGFDKRCMFYGSQAVEKEIQRLLPVVKKGGYLMAMDYQTPPGTSMETYRAYVRLMRECKGK